MAFTHTILNFIDKIIIVTQYFCNVIANMVVTFQFMVPELTQLSKVNNVNYVTYIDNTDDYNTTPVAIWNWLWRRSSNSEIARRLATSFKIPISYHSWMRLSLWNDRWLTLRSAIQPTQIFTWRVPQTRIIAWGFFNHPGTSSGPVFLPSDKVKVRKIATKSRKEVDAFC